MNVVPSGYGVTLTGFQIHVVDHEVEHDETFRYYPPNSVWAESKCGHILVRFDVSAVAKKGIADPRRCTRCDRRGRPPVPPATVAAAIRDLLGMARALAR